VRPQKFGVINMVSKEKVNFNRLSVLILDANGELIYKVNRELFTIFTVDTSLLWTKVPYEIEVTWRDELSFEKKFNYKGEILVSNGDTGTCDETTIQPLNILSMTTAITETSPAV